MDISKRKKKHIEISLLENIQGNISTGFEDIFMIHRALPEMNLNDVSTRIELFEKNSRRP